MNDFYTTIFVLIGTAVCIVAASDDTDPNYIVEPCGSDSDCDGIDIECVRNYFHNNGRCSKVVEANDNPVYKEELAIYIPEVNMTSVTTKTYLSHMNGKIEKFFYNRGTGNLVLSVKFTDLRCDAPGTFFGISQNGREPKVLREFVNATYQAIMTAVIPVSRGIDTQALQRGEYFVTFLNTDASFIFGPKITDSEDPLVQAAFKKALATIPTFLAEIFRTKASYYFMAYLQNYICNFYLSPVFEKYDTTVLRSANDIDVNDERYFQKPCASSDDVMECVRDYFDEHGTCSVVRYDDDRPLSRGKYKIHLPSLNSTLYASNGQWTRGSLRGKIESFYINKQTGNLVMSVRFEAISMYTPIITCVKNLRGREPLIISDYSIHIYPVTITAVIPVSGGLTASALRKAFVTAIFRQPALFVVGPKFTESKDPEMIKNIQTLSEDPMTMGQECLVTEAPTYFVAFLQKYICDFAIPNSSFPS